MRNQNMKNEYRHNKTFRDYVDRYCKKHRLSVDEAMTHELVRQVYFYYTDT